MHLDASTYAALLDGTLPTGERRALASHLESDCETCESFLRERRPLDGLDGVVDLALTALAPRGAGAGHDLEFARVLRQVAPSTRRRWWLPSASLAAAAAAAVALVGVAGLLASRSLRPPAWDAEKGEPGQAIPLRLRFLVLTPQEGGAPGLEKGVSGQEVPAAASLQFQVELGRPAWVTLARAAAAGAPEIFFERALPAGRQVVTVAGQPAAYPLASLAGPQRFLALAAEARIEPADVARAAQLGAAARRDDGPAITLDLVEVKVRP